MLPAKCEPDMRATVPLAASVAVLPAPASVSVSPSPAAKERSLASDAVVEITMYVALSSNVVSAGTEIVMPADAEVTVIF